MDKRQAEIAWHGVMAVAGPLLNVLNGERLPSQINFKELGTKDPIHKVIAFLHEWAAILDGAVDFGISLPIEGEIGLPAPVTVHGRPVFGVRLPDPESGPADGRPVIAVPEPTTVDGCPVIVLGRCKPDASINGRPLMCAQEVAWHIGCNVMLVHDDARLRGRPKGMPLDAIAPAGASKQRRRMFYRDAIWPWINSRIPSFRLTAEDTRRRRLEFHIARLELGRGRLAARQAAKLAAGEENNHV